jgi:23S rRNA pseudouridine2605 synthase
MTNGGAGPRGSDPPGEAQGERLQKVLAQAGFGSRRACEELITAGRVLVNGHLARLGQRVDPAADQLEVDGALVSVRPGLVHYLLNKPPGVVSTADDPEGRPTVVGLVPPEPRVFSVGRLDVATEGLLVLTNDGELAFRLTHPRFGITKEYLAEVAGRPGPGVLRRLREGVELEDGPTAPARAALVAPNLIRITIHEGRNRQVRRMCEAVGHPVRRLVRTRIGPVADRSLPPGQWRALRPAEVRALARAAESGKPAGAAESGKPAGAAESGKPAGAAESGQPSRGGGHRGNRPGSPRARQARR